MKKILLNTVNALLGSFVLTGCVVSVNNDLVPPDTYSLSPTKSLNVMSYNIRFDDPKAGEKSWSARKTEVFELIDHYHPAIFGLQEALFNQVKDLKLAFKDYAYFGEGREGGEKGESCVIFYDTQRFNLLKQHTFWLSPQGRVASVGWDAALPRVCTYGLFENKITKDKFYVFNTHFDHIGVQAREESAKLILETIAKVNTKNWPLILMGDFNAEPQDLPIVYLSQSLKEGKSISKKAFYGPSGSFNNFESCKPVELRIDYIFVQGFQVASYSHIDDKKGSIYPSDHLPVLAGVSY